VFLLFFLRSPCSHHSALTTPRTGEVLSASAAAACVTSLNENRESESYHFARHALRCGATQMDCWSPMAVICRFWSALLAGLSDGARRMILQTQMRRAGPTVSVEMTVLACPSRSN